MFLKNAAWNAVGNFVRQGTLAVQELGVRLLLPPVMVGVWELANLIRRVGNIWDLGFLGAAQRDLPAFRGLGQHDDEHAYRSTTFVAQVAAKIVVVLAVAVWAGLRWAQYDQRQRLAIAAASVMLILTAVIETLTVFYQTAEDYAPLSRITMIAGIASAAATLLGTWLWDVVGLLAGSVLGLAIYAGLLSAWLRSSGLSVDWSIRR